MVSPRLGLGLLTALVTDRSAWGVRASMSVSRCSAGMGSVVPVGGVNVAVLVSGPVAEGSIWTVKVKVTLAPTGRSTVVSRSPVPRAGLLTLTLPPPLLVVTVQVPPVAPAGRGSDTLAL